MYIILGPQQLPELLRAALRQRVFDDDRSLKTRDLVGRVPPLDPGEPVGKGGLSVGHGRSFNEADLPDAPRSPLALGE